jgi:peptidoglycan hydrolase-like protein with peptidoglycan-binding domain
MALRSPRFAANARLCKAFENKPSMNWGEVGDAVRIIQQALIDLNCAGPSSGPRPAPSGIFDDQTKGWATTFQTRHGLHRDGVVGHNTLLRLDRLLPSAGAPLPTMAPNSWVRRRFRVVFRSIATPVVPESRSLESARVVYSTYGFQIDEGPGMTLNLTQAQITQLEDVDLECQWNQESAEQRMLYSAGRGRTGVGANDIMVYYVNRIRTSSGEVHGCGGHRPGAPSAIVAAAANKYAMAHEVGHVLLTSSFNPVHMDSTNNLMYKAWLGSLTSDPPGLTEAQVRQIQRSPCCSRT